VGVTLENIIKEADKDEWDFGVDRRSGLGFAVRRVDNEEEEVSHVTPSCTLSAAKNVHELIRAFYQEGGIANNNQDFNKAMEWFNQSINVIKMFNLTKATLYKGKYSTRRAGFGPVGHWLIFHAFFLWF